MNRIYFENRLSIPDWEAERDNSTGYRGEINLSSLTLRATAVPEPGTLGLLGAGMAIFGFVRRRRSA